MAKFCLYGKIKKGWCKSYLRKTNGMIALTPRKNEWWFRVPILIYRREYRQYPWSTTFIWTIKTGFKDIFG